VNLLVYLEAYRSLIVLEASPNKTFQLRSHTLSELNDVVLYALVDGYPQGFRSSLPFPVSQLSTQKSSRLLISVFRLLCLSKRRHEAQRKVRYCIMSMSYIIAYLCVYLRISCVGADWESVHDMGGASEIWPTRLELVSTKELARRATMARSCGIM
jgi:hypothetical protein